MKKRILKFSLALIAILIIALFLFINSLKPTYKGEITLNGLYNKTSVYFDDYGIPHIYANTEEDAVRSLGYVHAQDRLWQMELLRRIAPGKLSELFGEAALENDKLFASLGIDEYSEESVKLLSKNSDTYKMANAYLEGINEFIAKGPTPIEYKILGLKKENFTLKDTYNVIGYMAFSFAMAHKTDPLLTSLQKKLGYRYLNELGIQVPANSTLIKNYNEHIEDLTVAINEIMENSPIPPFIGSNSWVVNGNKTESGKVLFANDPHIAFSSPSVWYEAHIETPNFESYGYYLGAVPFPVLSHNRNYAYGITMFENDDIDFYQERNHPNDDSKYQFKRSYRDYSSTKKTINVKDEEPITFELKSTIHGPVMNGIVETIDTDRPISMSWIYTKIPNQLLTSLYEMSRAKNLDDVKKGVAKIHAPGLNIMYGDADGNVSWWAAAQLYKLPENANSKLILSGTGNHEIKDYLNFTQNPQAHNPTWNYVYSANNQPDSIAGILYPGYYLPEDRAKRITELLDPKNDWTKTDFMKMISDTKSAVAPNNVKIITESIEKKQLNEIEKEALETLTNWDGDFNKKSIAATIYTKYIYRFLENTFQDEMGETSFRNFTKTHLAGRTIAEQLNKEKSIWWDNTSTNDRESRSDILRISFSETVAVLREQFGDDISNWTWNRVHTLEHKHPFGEISVLRSFFNVGPFEVAGSKEVINNLAYKFTNDGTYEVHAGPSTRRIIDFSDIENSMSILPTGNSGNPFSEFYKDQAEMYANNEFRKMKMNKEEIEKVSTKLTFTIEK
ncbi:penicillin acylase family protein [Urechidicola vernalis]|uniref:Penicillin acylase family protein n=1 Tax=Urechidicola vernalis TaxID=3075600 RepID=A0ABU2Y5X4_9FLAO|nr:penicillin acylase family protein [Urechidicola sp. P050]MDT0553591.1 penicillin acylase family protein [Urechidicola sp. P050]